MEIEMKPEYIDMLEKQVMRDCADDATKDVAREIFRRARAYPEESGEPRQGGEPAALRSALASYAEPENWDRYREGEHPWGLAPWDMAANALFPAPRTQASPPAEAPEAEQIMEEKKYACADCGLMRTAAEGGTTFTVCEACWDKHYRAEADGRGA